MSSKVARYIGYLLFRLLLPVVLLAGCALRYNIVSFLYLVSLLGLPLIPSPSATTIKGTTGIYLILLIVLGGLATLAHVVFHIVLAAVPEPYGYNFSNCSSSEKIARLIAVERLDGVPFVHVLRLVILDVVVLAVAILVFIVCYKVFNPSRDTLNPEDLPVQSISHRKRSSRLHNFLLFVGKFIDVLFLAACGIIVPSVASAVYFLSFLYIATWWSFYRGLGQKFAIFRICVLVWSGLHLAFLHLYQMQLFQEDWLPSRTSFWARLLGLTAVIKTDCGKPWSVEFHEPFNWPLFVNPPLLLALYFSVATETRYWKNNKKDDVVDSEIGAPKKKKRKRQKSSERESLVEAGEIQSYETFSSQRRDEAESPTMLGSDEEDGGSSHSKPKKRKANLKRSAMASLLVYIMKQSYVLSLIAMMAWSITFHSWLTFVLLLTACFIWMVPHSRKAYLLCSPIVVFYGEALLVIQFVYGMNLKELPEESNGIKLEEIGLKKFTYPCLQLALQILFTCMFWLTMRQYIRERQLLRKADKTQVPLETIHSEEGTTPRDSWFNIPSLDQVDGHDSQTVKQIGFYLWNLLSKYWIFVCTGMMLLISIQDVVVYRIIYLIFFLLFMLTFQISYTLWRVTMYVFWWVVIIYSMIILTIIYTYQFQDFPVYWHNNTGLSYQVLGDIGLEQFDTATLFVKLLTPTSFLILIILQVHYFHPNFLKLSDIKHVKIEDKEDSQPVTMTTDTAGETTDSDPPIIDKGFRKKVKAYSIVMWNICSEVWADLSTILWRVLEVHFVKVTIFTIFMVSISEVSAIGAVFVITLGVLMPIIQGWTVMLHVCRLWTAIAMVAKMIYQLSIIDKEYWNSNCTIAEQIPNFTTPAPGINQTNTSAVIILPAFAASNPFGNGTVNNALWVGLDKAGVFSNYLKNYILILVVLIFERVIHYKQNRRRLCTGITDIPKGVIFSDINRGNADKNLLSCAKYFANYFFYKFGLEICYIMMAVVICVRVDAYSVLYAILLGVLLLLNRQKNAMMWPIFTIILTVLLPIQYILCLGFPPGICIEYPWSITTETEKTLVKWLFLPSYFEPPEASKLYSDFFLLLFVCLQWQVFRTEAAFHSGTRSAYDGGSARSSYEGGSNEDILAEVEHNMPIPGEDFTTVHQSYLDVLKSGFFSYMYWVTLFIIFLAGTNRINLFSMGYIIGALCFMWYGQEFILKPLRKIRRSWNIFLGYTFIVIFLKASLQLLGCVYIDYLYDNQCWMVQLLGLTCLSPSRVYSPDLTVFIQGSGIIECKVEADDSGLSWDVVCFTFLLLQLRIYNSHYFRHIIASTQAQNALAARGAELINQILVTQVTEQKEDEKKVLENIKKKMEFLRSKKIQGSTDFIEPEEHFQAIRSGDYYLFEEVTELHPEDPSSITFGKESEDEDEGKADPLKLISTAIESGAKAAVEQAEEKEKEGEPTSTEEEKEEEKSDSKLQKVVYILKLIQKLLLSFADWMIDKFNNISKNHRLVANKLESEMRTQKEKIQRSKAAPTVKDDTVRLDIAGDGDVGPSGASRESLDLTEISLVDGEDTHEDTVDGNVQSKPSTKFESKKNKVYLLLEATYYAVVSRSELVCYFLMILNQILYCSLLSLPLPLMVFLWGMLSVPRPSKTFWITIITYTEAVVVIKYLFQFGFFSWNNNTDIEINPFWPPRIIGIEKQDGFVAADLVLLLALFIHRSILKRYGLWKDADSISADLDRVEEMISAPTTPIQEEVSRSFESRGQGEPGTSQQAEAKTIQDSDDNEDTGPSLQIVLAPFKNFYNQLTDSKYNATTDVYAMMFFCDFINFLILVFGYWAFGPEQASGGDNVTEYIAEDRIPVPFLIMLVAQFVLIIIDRALYLKKNILGKFVFQILLVILIHVLLFFILPYVTKRKFSENTPAQMFYFFKCLYFGLSAYQIRSSYPTRILGNFLTKNYNYINLFLFKGFLAIPFLLELRVLMDWIWTDSTLAIGSWLQMEDIYANIYVLKCWREAEKNYPTPRSQKKGSLVKYGVGGLLLVLIILIIWFPLVIFSFANTVYISNPPMVVTASIAIPGFQPLFKVLAQQQRITPLTTAQYNDLLTYFSNEKNTAAVSNLNRFEPQDITIVKLNGKSTSVWGISPPSKEELIKYLNITSDVKLEFEVTFSRKATSSDVSQSLTTHLSNKLDDATRKNLDQLLVDSSIPPVRIHSLYPRFFRLSKKAATELDFIPKNDVSMHLTVTNVSEWWNVNELLSRTLCPDPQVKHCGNSSTELTLITLNDRVAPAGFSFISGYGIIGLYVTFILLIGRILRLSTTGLAEKITYLELPHVDNILQLCLDVYLVREMHEFRLEEDLYAKLIFVYRSAETRIKWTRLPKDLIITDAKKKN
ncbi:piezo-type mechanosensitive ion channel component 1-like isoform X4 [Ostrea edulis]|uniref:piezo-type mechanosensitive ion channel component 1-like isoform X4 n=1 Tax=Ostrea edulis TaxID=37623 RepID=UPI0024AF1734|nr:piezo-type mechanosensitive ion channel component 1-like isoform X4 [Ostrea edulis]